MVIKTDLVTEKLRYYLLKYQFACQSIEKLFTYATDKDWK